MNRTEKQQLIDGLHADFTRCPNAIVVDFRGIKVPAVTEFRRKVLASGGTSRVVKNSLALRAAEGTALEKLKAHFLSTTGVAYTADDPVALALNKSANYYLLSQGLVYPYYFITLPGALRDKLSEAVKAAQKAAKKDTKKITPNLWVHDETAQGVKISAVMDISQDKKKDENDVPSATNTPKKAMIYPYLFRNIIKKWYRNNMEKYWATLKTTKPFKFSYDPNNTNIDVGTIFENGNPWVFVIGDQNFMKLDEIVEVKGGTLRMKKQPSELVFPA